MGIFREGETQKLIDDGNLRTGKQRWFFICYIDNDDIVYVRVNPLKEQELIISKCSVGGKLFMVWNGQWNTDIFPLDWQLALDNVKPETKW